MLTCLHVHTKKEGSPDEVYIYARDEEVVPSDDDLGYEIEEAEKTGADTTKVCCHSP